MGTEYAQPGIMSSKIYNMKHDAPGRGLAPFGSWLSAEISRRGLNQAEFAKLIGVGTSTVSRWINGRIPEAKFIDPISDVLVLDFDVVATRAGYRPKELLQVDPNSAEAELLPYIRAIDWKNHQRELEMIRRNLEFLAEVDRGEHDKSQIRTF